MVLGHVNGEDLSSEQVKNRASWVRISERRKEVEREPCLVAKARTGKEPLKVRRVDALKSSGVHRSRLVAKENRHGVRN